MSLPSDQKLAKLRILLRRADAAYEETARQARDAVMRAADERNRLYAEYRARAKDLGYCGNCEKPLGECNCIFLARATG